jgi:uncharacterized repeat protein (TIGR03803 family)
MTKLRHCWWSSFAPVQGRRVGRSGKLGVWRGAFAAFLYAATAIACPAQTLTTLASFDEPTTGVDPYLMSLVQGFDGNFYGTASGGGANSGGTVFEVTPGGTLSTVYSFCAQANCADGRLPVAGLVLATDGNFYGTTAAGGANDRGTAFEITPDGVLTTLYSFCTQTNCADGGPPFAGLLQAADGNFYGTTVNGGKIGPSCGTEGCGTVFELTASGVFSLLYAFCSQPSCTDGAEPFAGLMQGVDGSLYGTTSVGGSGSGTIFKIARSGTLTTLHSFEFDGSSPYAGLVQGTAGFYGTASQGGAGHNYGTVYRMGPGGAVKADAFDGADGATPFAGLIQATDGSFYGTTTAGGSGNHSNGGYGTIFKMGPKGVLSNLYDFCAQIGCPDGSSPSGGVVQGTDGNFYGTTAGGGANNNGAVFVLSVGLGPFVRTLPASAMVGAAVLILGSNLTGATGVTFNGTPATFTVASSSEITTTVPTGATSGTVQVTTPSGTLSSNVAFLVER